MFKSILRLLGTILIAVAFAFVLITCVGERTKVSGHSMEPHLHDHDQVLLDKLTYRFGILNDMRLLYFQDQKVAISFL